MLSGTTPFYDEDDDIVRKRIVTISYEFPKSLFSEVNPSVTSFISSALVMPPRSFQVLSIFFQLYLTMILIPIDVYRRLLIFLFKSIKLFFIKVEFITFITKHVILLSVKGRIHSLARKNAII